MRFPRATRPRVPDGGAPRIRHQRGAPCRRPALRRALDLRVLLFHEGGARARRRTGRMPSPANFGSRGLPVPPPRPALRGFHASAVGSGVPAGLGAASAPLAARCGSERRSEPRPATEICGPLGGSANCRRRLPCIHANALLRVGGLDNGRADDGTRPAGGDEQGARDVGRQTRFAVVALLGVPLARRACYLWRCQHPAFEASLAANLD